MRFILPFLIIYPLFFGQVFAQNNEGPKGFVMSYYERVKDAFQRLDKDHLEVVDEFYDKIADFHDPIGSIKGSENIKSYYREMYKNVNWIKFDFIDSVQQDKTVTAVWIMSYSTDKLKDGEVIQVQGTSIIKFGGTEDKVMYHRDYFDVGAMVYEHIPVLGWAVRKVKRKLGEH